MTKLKKIIDILKSKWLKDTSKTIILIAIIVAIFIGINILVEKLNPKDIDLTKEKLYTLTEESKKIVAGLPETDKIKIYMFECEERDPIVDLAKQYSKANKNIEIELVNPEDRPDLISKYNVETGYGYFTVVVVAGEKSKILNSYDFSIVDYNTGNGVDITEQRFTNSIMGVSSKAGSNIIYSLTGHGETSITTEMTLLKTYLELENYEIKELDLLSTQNIPEDCKTLIITSPEKDFAEPEVKAIEDYIKRGGNILWLNNVYSAKVETPNIKAILDMYGVNVKQDGIIIEQETNKMVLGTPYFVLPSIGYSEITEDLGKVLLFNTGKLEFIEDLTTVGVTKTDLLTTSEKSIYRTNLQDVNIKPGEGEKEEKSIVGALLEKQISDSEKTSKLVIIANSAFATDTPVYTSNSSSSRMPAIGFYNNREMVLNATNYLTETEDSISIKKEMIVTKYTPTEAQDRLVKLIIFSVPVLIIIIGIIVWQLRRRKK
ncbi:MAG: GldG family protein [Clostridia bacterium]|nr:GldG family protein [Clostridia bacterium]